MMFPDERFVLEGQNLKVVLLLNEDVYEGSFIILILA